MKTMIFDTKKFTEINIPLISVFLFIIVCFFTQQVYAMQQLMPAKSVEPNNVTEQLHDCAICLDTPDTIEDQQILKCKHSYCSECINEWFRVQLTCPECRVKQPESLRPPETAGELISRLLKESLVASLRTICTIFGPVFEPFEQLPVLNEDWERMRT